MQGFALYRQPYAHEYTLVAGDVEECASYSDLIGKKGFVIAPFSITPKNKLLIVGCERMVRGVDIPPLPSSDCGETRFSAVTSARADYQLDFANFHARLLNNDFQKLVLSRSIEIGRKPGDTPDVLFRKACASYPRMFISLVYTPQSGMWLTATPEILLSGSGDEWQTIALAGTVPYEENIRWSDKNIQEQRYVATYIIRQLEQFTTDFSESGPRTVRAGHLAHLRSDFHFRLPVKATFGALLEALHPTPAVCGLPKSEAFRFILSQEHHDRSYYSGFMGPLALDNQTHLYVTLRCMRIFDNAFRLYAGGGLLQDSAEEQEWQETEIKLDTMRNIINS